MTFFFLTNMSKNSLSGCPLAAASRRSSGEEPTDIGSQSKKVIQLIVPKTVVIDYKNSQGQDNSNHSMTFGNQSSVDLKQEGVMLVGQQSESINRIIIDTRGVTGGHSMTLVKKEQLNSMNPASNDRISNSSTDLALDSLISMSDVDITCQEQGLPQDERQNSPNPDQGAYGSMYSSCKETVEDTASTNSIMTSGQNLSSW